MTPISTWNKGPQSLFRQDAQPPGGQAPPWRQPEGFTLLEVMIAISLLAIALTTLFGSQAQSVSLASTIQFNTQAPLLARLKLSEFTAMADRPGADRGDFGDDFPGFHWQIETMDVTMESSKILNKPAESLQRLTLTVSRGDKNQYSYELRSYALKKPES